MIQHKKIDIYKLTFSLIALCIVATRLSTLLLLSDKGFWLDETATWYVTSKGIIHTIFLESVYVNHIEYYSLIATLQELGVHSEFGIRTPSLIFSFFFVILLFRYSCSLLPTQNFASRILWIIFGCSINYDFLNFSIQARPYAMLLCTGLVSIVTFDAFLKKRSNIYGSCYIISTALTIGSHPFYSVLLLIHILQLLLQISQSGKDRKNNSSSFTYAKEALLNNRQALSILFSAFILSILLLMFTGVLFQSSRMRDAYAFAESINYSSFATEYICNLWTILYLISILLCTHLRLSELRNISIFGLCITLLPAIFILLTSMIFQSPITGIPRYSGLRIIGEVLSLVVFFKTMISYNRRLSLLPFISLSALFINPSSHILPRENWDEVSDNIISNAPRNKEKCLIFLSPGHPESSNSQWVTSYSLLGKDWLAPLLTYDVDKHCTLSLMSDISQQEARRRILSQIKKNPTHIFVAARTIEPFSDSILREKVRTLLLSNGYTLLRHYGPNKVVELELYNFIEEQDKK